MYFYEVDARFDVLRNVSKRGNTSSLFARSKSVINLALVTYLKDNPNISSSGGIDLLFKEAAINQINFFCSPTTILPAVQSVISSTFSPSNLLYFYVSVPKITTSSV